MSIVSEMDAATARGKAKAANRLADDLQRLCSEEFESEFYDYVTDRVDAISALLRDYARISERIAVVQGDLDRESKEAESYHAFWIEERSKRIAAEAAVKAERERCAKIAEDQAIAFLSPEYASEQPLGSFCERFACERVAEAIRASVSGATEGGNG